jgi:peptidoglycan-associated lipoprotein
MRNAIVKSKIVMALSLVVLLAACKSTPMKPAEVEDKSIKAGSSTTAGTGADAGSETSGIKEVAIDSNANDGANGNNPLRDPNNILSKRNIYFDYNSDAVKAEYRPIVDAHAKYLLSHTAAKVVVQGNTDERGTREYNLSLGQRRSVAVKKALNLAGVQDSQIETVSYGEEKATQNCDGSACDNDRRADIVYENE